MHEIILTHAYTRLQLEKGGLHDVCKNKHHVFVFANMMRLKKLYDHTCRNFYGRYDHEASDAQKLMVVKKTQYSS